MILQYLKVLYLLHELLSTVANRIIEFKEDGKYVDKMMNYDEYLESVK